MPDTPRRDFEFSFGSPSRQPSGSRRRDDDEPMRILVMGDFSGRSTRPTAETGDNLARRPIQEIDAERFDQVMAAMGIAILDPLAPPADALPIEFRSLDDFHPDRLIRRVEAFSRLRSIRERLRDASKFDAAAQELVQLLGFDPAPAASAPATPSSTSGADDFASLLGEGAPRNVPPPTRGGFDVESFVKGIVGGQHVVKGADARQGVYQAAADAAISGLMRRLLHAPAFKDLEAAWRSVHRLVTSLETGESLTIHLLDVSRAEVITDLAAATRAGGLTKSGLHAQIVEATGLSADDTRWGLIIGDYTFARTLEDAVLLSGLGQLAAAAGAPLLAGASPSLVGCASFADGADPDAWSHPSDAAAQTAGNAWAMLRNSDEARYVGLGLPRVLLRLPYGVGGEPIDSFTFDELPPVPSGENASENRERHDAYLWGNPAFALAEVIASTFQREGWSMDAGAADDLLDMPVHAFTEGPGAAGPKRVMPCAEAWLTERGAYALRQAGVTPIMSIKGRDGVRIPGTLSIHQSGAGLAGRWS